MNKNILGGLQTNKMTNEAETLVASSGSAVSTSKMTLGNLKETLDPKPSFLNDEFSSSANTDNSTNETSSETAVESDTVTKDMQQEYSFSIAKYDAEKANPFADDSFPYPDSPLPVFDAKLSVGDDDKYMPAE